MKKLLTILLIAFFAPKLCAQTSSSYQYTLNTNDEESKKMAKICVDMLKKWNDGINRHSPADVARCFDQVAFYYTDCLDHSDIEKSLQSIFKKYPQYNQALSNINVRVLNSTHVEIDFDKIVRTAPGEQAKTYSAYLHFNYFEGQASIKKESDKLTDANVAKRKQTVLAISNSTPISSVFCKDNVNKHIKTGYWELVGFGDNPVDGPLAAAIVDATGFARTTMFGPIHKNYKNKPGTYYVGGHCAGGESGFYVIFVYDSNTKKLRAIGCE